MSPDGVRKAEQKGGQWREEAELFWELEKTMPGWSVVSGIRD